MALVAAVGFSALAGIPITQMTGTVAFLLIGVGVDDMFVVVDLFRRTEKDGHSLQRRFAETMLLAGPSITLTTTTSVASLLMGALSVWNAVSWWCINAGECDRSS